MARRSLCATLTASVRRCAVPPGTTSLRDIRRHGWCGLSGHSCLGLDLPWQAFFALAENTSDAPHLAIGKDMNGDAILFAASQYLRA